MDSTIIMHTNRILQSSIIYKHLASPSIYVYLSKRMLTYKFLLISLGLIFLASYLSFYYSLVLSSFALILFCIAAFFSTFDFEKPDYFNTFFFVVLFFLVGFGIRSLDIVFFGNRVLYFGLNTQAEIQRLIFYPLILSIIGIFLAWKGYWNKSANNAYSYLKSAIKNSLILKLLIQLKDRLSYILNMLKLLPHYWMHSRKKRFFLYLALFSILGIISYAFYIHFSGGFNFYMANLFQRNALAAGNHFFEIWVYLLAAVVYMAMIFYSRRWISFRVFICTAVAYSSLSLFLFSTIGTRTKVLSPILVGLILVHYLLKRVSFKAVAALAISFVLFFSLYLAFRQASGNEGILRSNLDELLKNPYDYVISNNQISLIDSFAFITSSMGTRFDYLYGSSFLYPIYNRIFRESENMEIVMARSYIFPEASFGMAVTFPGELFWNFGIAGLFIGMYALGFFCRMTNNLTEKKDWLNILLYGLVALFLIHLLARSFLTAINLTVTTFLPSLLVLMAILKYEEALTG